ncbi:MAG: dehypoxanthine futalosine cyclase [Euryarchaeota archaeon]|nr:dehypoxanthine futalosine cyclase [Euryarchaeota archaeon]
MLEDEPLSLRDGIKLFESSVQLTGLVADRLRRRSAGDVVTFVIDRNINYTNVCISGCKFCAFYRSPASKDAYVLTQEELLEKVAEAVKLGATQVLLQGGHHPELPFEYYENMLRSMKEKFPRVQRHAFSPSEIAHIAKISGSGIKETLKRLIEAGLQSIPGGGAEILDDKIRKKISPGKIDWKGWKKVMVTAHSLGIPTTATMVYGLTEGYKERVRHLLRIRKIQEKTHGFTAFIPWSFQPGNTALAREYKISDSSGIEYLKVVAASRILLSGAIRNIQASWVTQGANVAQVALSYGANDFGGTMIEENVVRAALVKAHAGTSTTKPSAGGLLSSGADSQYLPPDEIVRLIKNAGRSAAQRDTLYRILKRY